MRFNSLHEWLDWQLVLHDKVIELGLERVAAVAGRLGIAKIANQVIIVAGTNGKGSTVALYETWLKAAGFSVASYTSPHLLKYNERIKLDLLPVADELLCAAFEAVDQARAGTSLTYFEFGTLAALWLVQQNQPDFAILEVGLGGRLDAVNIIDADLVHLTSIGIDHQKWLGDTRELIGYEKAGVLRAKIPVVCNDVEPPGSVLKEIERLGCHSLQYQRDFSLHATDRVGWFEWRSASASFRVRPPLPGLHQGQNLAGVIAGLSLLLPLQKYRAQDISAFFSGTELAGRFQRLAVASDAEIYLDVGHNPDAARVLAENLASLKQSGRRVVVLLGMLGDKESAKFVAALAEVVDEWWLLTLECDRGLAAEQLEHRISAQVRVQHKFAEAGAALDHALSSLSNQDIMLVTGSFVTVELVLRANLKSVAKMS